MNPQNPISFPAPRLRTGKLARAAAGCALLLAVVGSAAQAQSGAADAQYAQFLRGLTATEVVRSKMASTPNARIIAVLAAIAEVGARNRNATATQLSTFTTAYNNQLRSVYGNDPNLVGSFAIQPAVRYLTRVTTVAGLDTNVGEAVAATLGLDASNANRQLNIIAFQNGTIPALATGDAVAVMLQNIFSSRDAGGSINPLVEAQAAIFLRSEGIEPYPTSSVLSSQYPEIVAALAIMPATAAAFDVERANNFANLRASTFAEFATVSSFVNGKITTLGTLAVTYPTLASTEAAAADPALVAAAENTRITDLVALNRSRAKLSFATAALELGTFAQATESNTLRTYANIQIRLADSTSSAANSGLVIGGSVLSGVGQALASPNKVAGFMQFAGALGFGAGLLMNNVRHNDVRPSPFQQVSNQITTLQNQVENIRFTMTTRFDRIDAGLQSLYTTMNGGFAAMTSYFIDTSISLQNIQTQLAISQSNLNRFEQNLYGILASGFNFDFVADMETALGYRDRTGSDLSYPQFNDYEGRFYSAAVNDAASAVFAGSDTALPYDSTGSAQLDNYPLGYNINALRTFPTSIGQTVLGSLHAANPTTWALNADVYNQFARENPWYNAKILSTTPTRIGTVLSAGQNSQTVMNAAKRQALFDRLIADHASSTTPLQTAIDTVRTAQIANSTAPLLDPWGGPAQVVPAPAASGRMSRYGSADGSGLLGIPFNGGATAWNLLPGNEFRTAMYLSLPQRTSGYYSWTFVRTSNWVAAGQAPIDPADITLGTYPLSSCSYEVQLWWNPLQVGGVNVSGVGTVYVPTDSNIASMQLVAKRRFSLRVWTGWGSEEAFFAQQWNGSNGVQSISGNFFNTASTSGIDGLHYNPNNFRPYWYAATTTNIMTADTVRSEVNLALAGRQRPIYQTIANAFSSPTDATNIRNSSLSLGVTAKLLDAYVSLALPESFAASDILRGPLRGIGEGIDAANAQRLYLDAIAALPTTLGGVAPTVETRIDTTFNTRRGMFQRELNSALATSRPAEQYPFMKWSLAGLTSLRDQGLRLAADDAYITEPGTPLVVSAADGLLANDAEQPGAAITAVLVSPPSSGTLVMNTDGRGGFRYTPAAGFTGSVSFTYKARADLQPPSTNTADSLNATVVIRVVSCLPAITAQPVGLELAGPLTAATSATFGVTATSATRASYQWRKDGVVLIDSDRIIGAATPTLSLLGAGFDDFGIYTVAVTTDCGTVLSAPAALAGSGCLLANECATANPIGVGSTPHLGSCFTNSSGLADFDCGGGQAYFDGWYRIAFPTEQNVTVDMYGSNYDTILAVYAGPCPGPTITPIVCNDDSAGTLQSRVDFVAAAGQQYLIRAGAWSNNAAENGNGVINVLAAPTAPACLADVNRDGVVDGSDFIAFINSFGIGDVAVNNLADVNHDSIIDGSDFTDFINAFAAGC